MPNLYWRHQESTLAVCFASKGFKVGLHLTLLAADAAASAAVAPLQHKDDQ
jgi:hypothetical protein